MHPLTFECTPPLPVRPYPIVVLGAGGIVKDAHLPAYRLAGFPVHSIANRSVARARALAEAFAIPRVFASIEEAVADAPADAIFDLTLPASMFAAALRLLPRGAHVLIQKPMGEDLEQAREILAVCRERDLSAAINCQLRFAPFVIAARDLVARGVIGDLLDLEMRLTCYTPWQLFPFLQGIPRMEIVYHSVHYVDLMRSFLGDPRGVHALTLPHPGNPGLAQVRSAILLNYGPDVRATITTNHCHHFGGEHQESYLKWEGTRGAIRARVGLLMDYPRGVGDRFEVCLKDTEGNPGPWTVYPLPGSWFPEAFIGSMAVVQRHKEGLDAAMVTSVEDVVRTMAVVEAAYLSSASGGTPPPAV
jgi:predicted dehydrogenase